MIMAANGRTDRNEERASIARASCLPFCRLNTGAVDALRWQMHLEGGVFTSITTADTTPRNHGRIGPGKPFQDPLKPPEACPLRSWPPEGKSCPTPS